MLELAMKARIPVIRVRTTDIFNLPHVLAHLAPDLSIQEGRTGKADLVYVIEECTVSRDYYDQFAEHSRILLLVNQGEDCPFAFDAGEVPVPRELMENVLKVVAHKNKIGELLPCFNGLTLKQMAEVIKLTEAQDKALTPSGVMRVRALLAGKLQGLGHVETKLPLYLCPPEVKAWVDKNRRYFLEAKDDRLIPRGILFNGDPGVGKTMGAKHIASEFGVPLYRLDLSSVLGKWVGDSESSFARVLNTLDQEEPAVLLVDEVEKDFADTEDQGTTKRLMSQFLWWLAEHRSRVLTVMTTNDLSKLPKELVRAGRIDTTLTLGKLKLAEQRELAAQVLAQFLTVTAKHREGMAVALAARAKLIEGNMLLSHAEVTAIVIDFIKSRNLI